MEFNFTVLPLTIPCKIFILYGMFANKFFKNAEGKPEHKGAGTTLIVANDIIRGR